MPVTPSAKKALRASEAKQTRNLEIKANLKRVLKNATSENANMVVSTIDKAAKRHIIHPNKAARLKSALAKRLANPDAVVKKTTRKSTAKKTTTRTAKKK